MCLSFIAFNCNQLVLFGNATIVYIIHDGNNKAVFKIRQTSSIWILRFQRTNRIQRSHWWIYWLHRFDLVIFVSTWPLHPSLHYFDFDDLRLRNHHGVLVQNHKVSFLAHLNRAHDILHVTLPGRVYGDSFDGLIGGQTLRFAKDLAIILHFSGHWVIDASDGVDRLAVIIRVHGGS